MKLLHKLAMVASAAFFVVSAQAQNAGTVSNHAVPVGKGPGVSGYSSVAPGTAGIPLTSTGATTDPSFSAIAAAGIQSNAVTNAKVQPGAANTFKGSLNGSATSDIALTACTLSYQITKWVAGTGWQCGLNPVLPSRAIALTLDLSAFSVVTTQGYATAGDGGGATFQKVATANFQDSFVTGTPSITTAGSGLVNGSYLYVTPTGGNGVGLVITATVSGNVLTAVSVVRSGGFGYAVGNVLTLPTSMIGGAGVAPTITVTSVSTVRASFTDAAANKLQYVVGDTGSIYAKQFGAKFDWTTQGGDAGATDDSVSLQAALNFAGYTTQTTNTNGQSLAGSAVILPPGNGLICSPLIQQDSTQVRGQGTVNTTIKVCDAFASNAANIWTMCDPNTHIACFGVLLADVNFTAVGVVATPASGTAIIYSNSAQQNRFISNVSVYSGKRGCLRYDQGYGGAANLSTYDFFCTLSASGVSPGVHIDSTVGTVLVNFRNLIVEGNTTVFAVNILGGQVTIDGFHTEGIPTPISVNQTVSTHSTVIMNATGGSACTSLVTLQSTNTPGNFAIFNAVKQGACTNLVANGQPAGSSRTADAKPKDGWVFFNP